MRNENAARLARRRQAAAAASASASTSDPISYAENQDSSTDVLSEVERLRDKPEQRQWSSDWGQSGGRLV